MSYRTIKLKRYHDIVNEYPAGGSILPGAIVALQSDLTVDQNTTAGGVSTMVALEDELQGKTTREAYAEGDPVQCWNVGPGDEVLLLCSDAYDPDIGDYVTASATTGFVKAAGSDPKLFQVIGDKIVDDEDNHRLPCRRV